MAAASSNSVLASIFILSLLLLLLVPYTLFVGPVGFLPAHPRLPRYFFFGGKSSEKKAAASGAGLRLSALQAWLRSLDVTHRRLTQPEQEKKAASNARSSLSTPGVCCWQCCKLLELTGESRFVGNRSSLARCGPPHLPHPQRC